MRKFQLSQQNARPKTKVRFTIEWISKESNH